MRFFCERDVKVISLVNWLNWASGNKSELYVALPMIQRGSVWEPRQIIDLWDSLLQGMPIGCMLASELPAGTTVRRPGKSEREVVPAGGGVGLIDGQQRTLAMLAAWPLQTDLTIDQRVWIDFADDPAPGQLLRLRVTTRNQPFGFQRIKPNSKLSLNDRRKAHEAFHSLKAEQEYSAQAEQNLKKPYLNCAWPFSYEPGLPVNLGWLIDQWINNQEEWHSAVTAHLESLEGAKIVGNRSTGKWQTVRVWSIQGEKMKMQIHDRITSLSNALCRLWKAEIPFIRVDERFFKIDPIHNTDPPLAILFNRISNAGAPLSDADYVYSVIKHLRPETYDLVEALHAKPNVASLLTATDLVMSTVRLAASKWTEKEGPTVADTESPRKQDFHRLLQHGNFIKDAFLPLIQTMNKSEAVIGHYFDHMQQALEYRSCNDIGLPKQAFPLLKRPLVQVLLRMAQDGYPNLDNRQQCEDVVRLVLFWLVAVIDESKASRLAYDVIKEPSTTDLGSAIYAKLIKNEVAVELRSPEKISEVAFSPPNTDQLRCQSRFVSNPHDNSVAEFYRKYWWRPWTYQHPVLLWLQRKMVAEKLDVKGDPMAGNDRETIYDYDHILPSAHWGDWRGSKRTDRLLDFADETAIWVVGNSIGNIRVWESTLNRSDSDASPRVKLKLDVADEERQALLNDSLVGNDQIDDWATASGNGAQPKSWNCDRALAFQRAVETRTFHLYKSFFDQLGFSRWSTSATD